LHGRVRNFPAESGKALRLTFCPNRERRTAALIGALGFYRSALLAETPRPSRCRWRARDCFGPHASRRVGAFVRSRWGDRGACCSWPRQTIRFIISDPHSEASGELRERDGLSAGGKWIRTLSPAPRKGSFRDARHMDRRSFGQRERHQCREGPEVQIRHPPAGSQLRTRLPPFKPRKSGAWRRKGSNAAAAPP
jgi:hypothetical protein